MDGKITPYSVVAKIEPGRIQMINVLKGQDAYEKYGSKARNGVIEITTKSNEKTKENSNDNMPLPPPAPPQATSVTFSLKEDSVNIKFSDGHMETISKEEAKNQGLLDRIIRNSKPDKIPDMIFTKEENEASFPGGQENWTSYISFRIIAALDTLKAIKRNNYGTCVVKFIVNKDGSVSNVEAATMKNTQLSYIAINAIRTGPKWIPATQNGHIEASYRLQPVTLTNADKK